MLNIVPGDPDGRHGGHRGRRHDGHQGAAGPRRAGGEHQPRLPAHGRVRCRHSEIMQSVTLEHRCPHHRLRISGGEDRNLRRGPGNKRQVPRDARNWKLRGQVRSLLSLSLSFHQGSFNFRYFGTEPKVQHNFKSENSLSLKKVEK